MKTVLFVSSQTIL